MIPIRNIYYMLSYAFTVLNQNGYKDIETEEFQNVADLCSAILLKGMSIQIKRGLNQTYIPKEEELSALRGKINVSSSIKKQTMQKGRLVCSFDEYSVNSPKNQIVKSTMLLLLKSDIPSKRKSELKKTLIYLKDVSKVNLHTVNWNQQYDRNNETYRMLISVCYLVVKGLLQSKSDGSTRLMDFLDEQRMCHLYEKFILEYYRKDHPEISANASQIKWMLDTDETSMLPIMQSDITLEKGNQVLIIDAKYYDKTTVTHFDTQTVHTHNLYQIFTYVKNKEYALKDTDHKVSGMLLYAKTDETKLPNYTYRMSGNDISVKTLNLDCDFNHIRSQLDSFVSDFFEDRNN